ncbi:hypothetical protein F5X99DRAFT_416473 [Biscogniauxia marginata]|nr:hypothetical protein F5X99DRAFT_416473 [Biscogniauxia marginata]
MEPEYISKFDEIIEAKDDSQGCLTFGFELEFLLASVKGDAQDPDPDETRALLRISNPYDCDEEVENFIISILRQIDGLPVRSERDDDFHPPHDNVPIYDAWRITHDRSLKKTGRNSHDPYKWQGRELSSVVMSSDDLTYPKQIEDVCRALRQARIHLNETTSVHVHVGRGDEPFSLLTIKKFATLYWLTEEKLLALHHPCRQQSQYSYLLTQMSNLAVDTAADPDPYEWHLDVYGLDKMEKFVPSQLPQLLGVQLRKIWGCYDIEQLARLMRGAQTKTSIPRGAVGFKRFLPAGKSGGNTQTFEWRQMAGCLDPEHIIQWVRVCVAFTDFARKSSAEEFNGTLGRILERGSSYTGFDLLGDLGLHAEAQYFKKRVDGYSRSQEIYEGQEAGNLFVRPL